jgi:plasmid maintenance system antidote protein VapI
MPMSFDSRTGNRVRHRYPRNGETPTNYKVKPNVADQLRRAIVLDNRSITDLAISLGIGRPGLSNVLNGKAMLSIELALKLERLFGIDARQMLVAQLNEQIAKARKSKRHA